MLPGHFTYQIGWNLGGVCERFAKHKGNLWNHALCIPFRNIKLCMLRPEMICNLPGKNSLIICFILHSDCEGLHLAGI